MMLAEILNLSLANDVEDITTEIEPGLDPDYGLLTPQQTIIVRAYSDDGDDQVLAEIRPRFIVMYEPNQDFIRRIEVGRKNRIYPTEEQLTLFIVLPQFLSWFSSARLLYDVPTIVRRAQIPVWVATGEGCLRTID